MRRSIAVVLTICCCLALASAASARVLLVGTYHGIAGQFKSVQAAVNAADRGDWILIAPGDYKTTTIRTPRGVPGTPAAVLITKPDIYIRGMNRNTVIVDGTTKGAPCNRKLADQSFGPKSLGLNGLMVWKARNVWIQNLTACNFLNGKGDAGNQIWWNGGDGSYHIGGHGYYGSYLTTTSTFFKDSTSAAGYGVFSSNWSGGAWNQIYASNFDDSGFYIGACQQQCDQEIDHGWSEFNALGYSGTNSGGRMLIENSRFDHNKDGFDTNSQNADEPAPQNGACPKGVRPPVKGAPTCWVFIHNVLADNNDNSVPEVGTASSGPLGTGMSLSGARNDTVMDNTFIGNRAWGLVVVPYLDSGPPCLGGVLPWTPAGSNVCEWDEYGDAILHNVFSGNGAYRNPTNGDFEQLNFLTNPDDCFAGNQDAHGLTAVSVALETSSPKCTGQPIPSNFNIPFLNEILCDTGVSIQGFGCQPGDHYPAETPKPVMHPLPKHLPTMPNPCAGVPSNPWCTNKPHG